MNVSQFSPLTGVDPAVLRKIPVVLQDTYTIAEVAILLNISKNRVYDLAKLSIDPLPVRTLPQAKRGGIVLRDELLDWIKRNLAVRGKAPVSSPQWG